VVNPWQYRALPKLSLSLCLRHTKSGSGVRVSRGYHNPKIELIGNDAETYPDAKKCLPFLETITNGVFRNRIPSMAVHFARDTQSENGSGAGRRVVVCADVPQIVPSMSLHGAT
jgi:hypothetical protein